MSNNPPDITTDFGFQHGSARREEAAGARGVRQRRTALRSDERPHVAGHPPRLETGLRGRAAADGRAHPAGPGRRHRGHHLRLARWRRRAGHPVRHQRRHARGRAGTGPPRGRRRRASRSWSPTRRACRCRTAAWTWCRSHSACATSPTSRPRCARRAACCGPAGGSPAWSSPACRWRRWRRSTTRGRSPCCRGWGKPIAGDADSYRYLAESIRTFPDQDALEAMMRQAGLHQVRHRNLSGGIAAIHTGRRL